MTKVIVEDSMLAHDANNMYGDQYGIDWEYPKATMTTPEIKTIIEQVNDNESLEAARPKVSAYLRDCEDDVVRKYVSDRWRVIVSRYVDTKRLSRQY